MQVYIPSNRASCKTFCIRIVIGDQMITLNPKTRYGDDWKPVFFDVEEGFVTFSCSADLQTEDVVLDELHVRVPQKGSDVDTKVASVALMKYAAAVGDRPWFEAIFREYNGCILRIKADAAVLDALWGAFTDLSRVDLSCDPEADADIALKWDHDVQSMMKTIYAFPRRSPKHQE